MMARIVGTKRLADVRYESNDYVHVTLHKSQRAVRWRKGEGRIELIEHASMNPQSPDYQPGGKVIRVV